MIFPCGISFVQFKNQFLTISSDRRSYLLSAFNLISSNSNQQIWLSGCMAKTPSNILERFGLETDGVNITMVNCGCIGTKQEPGHQQLFVWWKLHNYTNTGYRLLFLIQLTHWAHDKMAAIRHFKTHFLEWKCCILIQISLKFVPNGLINIQPSLFQIMSWRETGANPLSEAMMGKIIENFN